MSEFQFHTLVNTTGESKEILEGVNKAYGFVPNLFAYMAEAPVTIKAYMQLNELLDETAFSKGQVQLALLAISLENDCDFCATAHHAMSTVSGSNAASIQALVNGEDIDDAQDSVLVDTVREVVRSRGWLADGVLGRFLEVGFSQRHYLELMLLVAIKTLSNYSNHLTKPEANPELLAMIKP
ncbi:MAG: AhpD family alkylhydroperoxidase [Flavobacteriales bacterium]|jgi:AhpD family alkylhydroperoxidase